MSLTPSYLADLATRRHDRILSGWSSASSGGPLAVWRALAGSRAFEGEVDAFEQSALTAAIEADAAEHGTPSDFDGFVAHYNRVVARRSALIDAQYTMEARLGEGAPPSCTGCLLYTSDAADE